MVLSYRHFNGWDDIGDDIFFVITVSSRGQIYERFGIQTAPFAYYLTQQE